MDTNDCPLTPEELDRTGAAMVRKAFVLLGRVPVVEMTPEEVERHLRWVQDQARPGRKTARPE